MESNDTASTTAEDNALSQSPPSPPNSVTSGDSNSLEHQHPLLNPVVVDLIVKHLKTDFEQLKTLRLVSKVWTQATLHHWRSSCAVLTLVPDPPNFCERRVDTGVSVCNFFKEFQDPESPFQLSQKPFSKYKLKDFTLDFQFCGRPDGAAYRFWNAIGPLMKSVHFYKCLFEGPTDNPNDLCPRVQFLVDMIPNLKDLVLTDLTTPEAEKYWDNDGDDDDGSDDDDIVEDLEDVKRGSPHFNLRTLTVYGDLKKSMSISQLLLMAPGLEVIKGEDQYLRTLLKPIHRVRYLSNDSIPQPLSNLKTLDLIDSSALNHEEFPWDSLDSPNPLEGLPAGSQVPLETLSLHLGALDEDRENLDIYLKSFSSTLTTFTGLRPPVGTPYLDFLSYGVMTALTELQLMGTIVSNLGFLKSTPNLKKLRMDLGCFEKREKMKDVITKYNLEYLQSWKYEKYKEDMVLQVPRILTEEILCTELEHLEIDFEFPEGSLRLLGKWMPNLKIFKTILNVGTVPVVCEVWRELTELVCLHGSKIEDYCFIHTEEINGLPGNPLELKICDLKDLERFQLNAYCDDCELTDDVVYKGFLKMPGLKYVQICVNSQMSVEAEEALRKGVQFCKVVRDDHDDCGGSSLFGSGFVLCDRCSFRREVIYGVNVRKDEDGDFVESEDSEEDNGDIPFGFGLSDAEDEDADASRSSGDSVNSAGTM